MNLRERLLLFIDSLNIEKARFEKEVGLSNGFVDKASDNTRRSSLNRISNRYPQLNIEWLMTGKGEMINPGSINIVGDGKSNYTLDDNSDTDYMEIIRSQQRVIENLSQTITSQQRMIENMYSKKDTADIA